VRYLPSLSKHAGVKVLCGSGPRCWYTDTDSDTQPHAAQHPRHAGGEMLDRQTKNMPLFISAALNNMLTDNMLVRTWREMFRHI
jgi:hypothetical protein